MSYSIRRYTGTGTPQVLDVPPYLDKSHIKVFVSGVRNTTWSWVNSGVITITAALAAPVVIQRLTSPDERLVDYLSGVTLTEADLDQDSLQAFYLAQEARDVYDDLVGLSTAPLQDALSAATQAGLSAVSASTSAVTAAAAAASAIAAGATDGRINVKAYGATGNGTTDDRAAIQAAATAALAGNLPLYFPPGRYRLLSAGTTTFECPRDDGSYSPSIGGGETTLSPETAVTMPVCVSIPGSIVILGAGVDQTFIEGSWTHSSSAINTSQSIGFLLGANKDSYNAQRVTGLTLRNFFMPLVVQGSAVGSTFDLTVDGAAIASAVQSADGNTKWSGRFIRCFAGVIVGGWWLNRNRTTSAGNMPSSFGGSYPASDIFRGTWGENLSMSQVEWTAQPVFDARADSVDQFFNTYFFKSANSAVYPTGRATVNADSSFTGGPGYPAYRGIFGTPWAIISRNGRYGSRLSVDHAVSSGNSRPFMYVNAGSQISMRSAYFENTCLVNPNGGTAGNTMGVSRADPYHTGAPVALSLWLENEGGGGTYLEEISGVSNAPGVPGIDPARRYFAQSGTRSSTLFELLGGVRFQDSDTPLTRYKEGTFSPVLNVGGTPQSGLTVNSASYVFLNSRMVFINIALSAASFVFSGSGAVTISGLKFPMLGGGDMALPYFSNYVPAGHIGIFTNGSVLEFHKAANRGTPVTNTDLAIGDLVLQLCGVAFLA